MRHRTRILFNLLLFQLGWWSCVLFAAPASVVILAVLIWLHVLWLYLTPALKPGWLAETGLIFIIGVIGTATDSALQFLGVLDFPQHDSVLCPAWLSLLWVLFATTLNHSLRFLSNRKVWAAVGGAIGGALSYEAGDIFGRLELGAITQPTVLAESMSIPGFIWIALVWAVLLPCLFQLRQLLLASHN